MQECMYNSIQYSIVFLNTNIISLFFIKAGNFYLRNMRLK